MRHIIMPIVLLFSLSIAMETVVFENNWARQALFTVVSASPSGCEIVFSTHRVVIDDVIIDGNIMQTVGIPGIFLPNNAGAPNLAGTARYIAVPRGAQAQVTVLDARTEVYEAVDIAPAPVIPLDTDDSPLHYEKDMTIYSRNAYYPDRPVMLSEPRTIRGVDAVLLGVTPMQYNPVTKELVVYKDIRIKIDFIGGTGQFGEDRLRSRFWEPILQNQFLNYESLPKIDFYSADRMNARDGYEYIIIVPDDPVFEAWGDTIKYWRSLQGISSEVFTLSDIGASDEVRIKNFLRDAYNTWNPAPVAFLLLSDYPSSGMRTYGITSKSLDHPYAGTYVSDNWYADVDETGDDTLPEFFYGRICAQDEADLSTMVSKFLSYERAPYTAANFYDEPLVACGWQTDRWFQLCAEVIRGFFITAFGKNPARQYAINDGNPTPGSPWSTGINTNTVVHYWYTIGWLEDTLNPYDASWWSNGSSSGITSAINSGAFLIQHRDHGGEEGWGEPEYSNDNLDDLTNDMYTFVWSSNCLTGKYNWHSECFSEKFHRSNHGAVGVNAASQVSYSFLNDTYVWGCYDGMWPAFDPGYPSFEMTGYSNLRPCVAQTYGKYYLEASNWPYYDELKPVTYGLFHHFGDVFNTLYSEIPQYLSISHNPAILAGAPSFTVSADDSSVIALTIDGQIIGVAEGTGAPISISISPLPLPGQTMKVTVTKANYYRYDVDVPVVSEGPYVYASTKIIDDSSGGNDDGHANPGEAIDYGVWAKNIGTQDAYSVYGIFTTNDTYATITIDSSWYGSVAVNDSALSNPYYELTIGNGCPDGHAVTCTLTFHDGNDSVYVSVPVIHVYAPLLTYQGVSVVNDDNANNLLEPGETADLIVTLANEGSACAENVTATLTTTSPDIVITDDAGSFGTVDTNATSDNTADPFTVAADDAAQYASHASLSLIVQSGVYVDTLAFTLSIGRSAPSDTGYYYAYYSGGPHMRSPVFDWIAIDSTQSQYPGVSMNLSDDVTVPMQLPFTFRYYGVNYDTLSISSNGWVAMGTTYTTDNTNTHIPNSDGPAGMIAGMWCDLDPGNGDAPSDVYHYYDDQNHRFIIEYFRCEHYPNGNEETFEIILYDPAYYPTPTSDGEIEIQYLVSLQRTGMTIGIENSTENVGVEYYYNGTYDSLAGAVTDSFAILYTTYPPQQTGIEEREILTPLPLETRLRQFAPNPFARTTAVSFQIAHSSTVELKVYDATGRLVRTLSDGVYEPGFYTMSWNGDDARGRTIPTGIYFVRFTASARGTGDEFTTVDKVVFLR
jgi:hypothetical protein